MITNLLDRPEQKSQLYDKKHRHKHVNWLRNLTSGQALILHEDMSRLGSSQQDGPIGLKRLHTDDGGRRSPFVARRTPHSLSGIECMKGLAHLTGYMGVENMPHRHKRADVLLANQEHCRRGAIAVKRNTAEMLIQCVMESSYRQHELLEAPGKHADVLASGKPWEGHLSGDYFAYVMRPRHPILNADSQDDANQETQAGRSALRNFVEPVEFQTFLTRLTGSSGWQSRLMDEGRDRQRER